MDVGYHFSTVYINWDSSPGPGGLVPSTLPRRRQDFQFIQALTWQAIGSTTPSILLLKKYFCIHCKFWVPMPLWMKITQQTYVGIKSSHIEKIYVLFVFLYIIKQSKFFVLVLNMFKRNFLYDIFLLLAKCAWQLCKYRRFYENVTELVTLYLHKRSFIVTFKVAAHMYTAFSIKKWYTENISSHSNPIKNILTL